VKIRNALIAGALVAGSVAPLVAMATPAFAGTTCANSEGYKNYAARNTIGSITVGFLRNGVYQCYATTYDQSCLQGGSANDYWWRAGNQCI
jgi:cbb3-type cytochrome oxidase cytochrome c subunit